MARDVLPDSCCILSAFRDLASQCSVTTHQRETCSRRKCYFGIQFQSFRPMVTHGNQERGRQERTEGWENGMSFNDLLLPGGPTSQQSIQLWVYQWINPLMNVGCSGSTPPTQHYYRTKLSNIGLGGDFVGVMNILILETYDTIYFLKYKFEPGVLLAESSCPDCLLPNNPPPVPK